MAASKVFYSGEEAMAPIRDGVSVLVGGHGPMGVPHRLVKALLDKGVTGLTCISNALQYNDFEMYDVGTLVRRGMVNRLITSFEVPHIEGGEAPKGAVEVEPVPLGTLVERIRAEGAGLGGFFVSTGIGTPFADGKETRTFEGQEHTLETPIKGDFALIRAHRADALGNLVYWGSQRNCNPIMAMAAAITIVEVDEVVEIGQLDPEMVITPGIYVHRIVTSGSSSERGGRLVR